MSSKKIIKVGWIGSGFVGQVAHLNLYEDINDAKIVALSELRQSLGKKLLKKILFLITIKITQKC